MTSTPRPASTSTTISTVLLAGGTGKTGRRVAERLTTRPDLEVRLGSRSTDRPGITTFDWYDDATWNAALAGVDAAYLSFSPDVAMPGAPEIVAAFTERALSAGVRRLVILSGRGEAEARRTEESVTNSGVEWTVVRCSWFAQNFSEGFLVDPILDGHVALPVDAVPEPFVDADDIADVAAAALVDDGHAGRLYELTGPRALTFPGAIGEIAAATGRPIRFESISVVEFVEALVAEGLPDDLVSLYRYLFTEVLDGRNAEPADGVRVALGRDARDFSTFVATAAAAGAWRPTHAR
jgi:uncharacterized protein YbjT (DUF2867 family)